MVLGAPIAGAYYYYHIASVGLSIFTIPSQSSYLSIALETCLDRSMDIYGSTAVSFCCISQWIFIGYRSGVTCTTVVLHISLKLTVKEAKYIPGSPSE